MYLAADELAHEMSRDARLQAAARLRADRLVAARRWQRRAERANLRARMARAAVR